MATVNEKDTLMEAAEAVEDESRNEQVWQLKAIRKSTWASEGWLEGMSARMMHVEKRAMLKGLLGHELVRLFTVDVSAFCPPPRGEWAWLLRKLYDNSIYGLRVMRTHYFAAAEDWATFVSRAEDLMRLFLEVAVQRILGHEDGALRRSAVFNLMQTMRRIEEKLMRRAPIPFRLFTTFEEQNRELFFDCEAEGIHHLPSFRKVSEGPLLVETQSLMRVQITNEDIMMTQGEVRCLHAFHNRTVSEDVEVPGKREAEVEMEAAA